MQTLEFTSALTEIVADLKMRELDGLLKVWFVDPLNALSNQQQHHPIPPDQKKNFSSYLFESFAGYDRLSREKSTAKILQFMEAKELYEAGRLTRIINLITNTSSMEQIRSSGGNLELIDFFETLKAFIRAETTCRTLLRDEKIGKVDSADSLLELQVTDYDEEGVEPGRMSAIFLILAKLQMNIARLLGAANDRLIVKYLDSGSEFKIGLEGLKEPIDALRELIHSVWDRIKYSDQDTFERNMHSITAGLDLLEKTKQRVESCAITQEEADNLRERVLRDANDLIGLGVSPPLKGPSADEERKRLIGKRSTKLLTAGSDTQQAEAAPPDAGTPHQAG
jgi:hypothetical protein